MKRPTRQTPESMGWAANMGSDIDYILELNTYIDWLEGGKKEDEDEETKTYSP